MVTQQLGPGRFQMTQQQVCDDCPNVKWVPLKYNRECLGSFNENIGKILFKTVWSRQIMNDERASFGIIVWMLNEYHLV